MNKKKPTLIQSPHHSHEHGLSKETCSNPIDSSINEYSFCPRCGVDISQYNHENSCPYNRY